MKLRILPEAAARIDVARAWWRSIARGRRSSSTTSSSTRSSRSCKRPRPRSGSRSGEGARSGGYYEVVGDEVRVLTLWGAVKGAPPKL